jgi:hypothetical protein
MSPSDTSPPVGLSLTFGLTPEQLDLIAGRVAELLSPPPAPAPLVDAQTVAQALGVSRDTVYSHASELGGQRIGNGDRPRWRFDLDRALAAWNHRSASEGSQGVESPPTPRVSHRRRQSGKGSGRTLLPIHGQESPQRRPV